MSDIRKSARARALARTSVVLAAVLAFAPLLETSSARAEKSDAAMELQKKRKALRSGQSYARPQKANGQSGYTPMAQGKATTVTEVVADKTVQPFLSEAAVAGMAALENRYAQIASAGGWPAVPKGTYKKGTQNAAIEKLNKRLFIEGYLRPEAAQGEFASVYTSATADAVARFQTNMGLASTGAVDGPTLAALNVPASARLATIRANLPRVAIYAQNLGDRYVIVNVPAQQIQTVSGGRVYSQHNAIVGRPERPTPVAMTALSDINFNPYWNAPASIVEKDIIPKMTSGNADILEKMNIKVFKGFGGPEVNPNMVNWNRAIADDYHFRQEPGPENAMATAKINFPSPFGIYLHDTPEKHLFQAGGRFFSSGCVRVDKMSVLLNWVLNGQEGYDAPRIASLGETLERIDVKLTAPPQLRVVYLTAWPAAGGVAAFRGDIYQLDGSGFVTGQPLPPGEKSADGARYVLKPVPRQVAALEADEAEGFSWFSRAFGGRPAQAKPARPATSKTSGDEPVASNGKQPSDKTKKTAQAAKPAKTAETGKSEDGKKQAARGKSGKKQFKGLFDWANHKPDSQQAQAKKPPKKVATGKVASGKKKPADSKVEAAKKPVGKAKTKPVEVASGKPEKVDPKKKVSKVAAKAPAETETPAKAKEPAPSKKAAPTCTEGKQEKGCKPVAEAATKKKPAAPVAN